MSQQQLCEQFGTSRMPVRDALRVLAHEGLIITDTARHTIVAPLSRQDLFDAYLIEGTLAGISARRASQNATKDDLANLERFHEQMQHSDELGDHIAAARENWNLHRSINRLAGSRKLLSALKTVSLDLPRGFLVEVPEWSAKSIREHEEILANMRKRRHAQVASLMTDHIIDSGRGLITYLESQGLELD